MYAIQIRKPVVDLIKATGLHEHLTAEQVESGIAQLEIEVQRLALDAHAAEVSGVALPEACADFENYPHIARFHAMIDDVALLGFPDELQAWLRDIQANGEPAALDESRTAMVAIAAQHESPFHRAVARFALFEGVRLNLVLHSLLAPRETYGGGMLPEDFSGIAEATVGEWLSAGPPTPRGIRPYTVIVAAALKTLSDQASILHKHVGRLQADFFEQAQKRAALEEAVSEMDAPDAVLIRNAYAEDVGEQRLSIEQLMAQHTHIFGHTTRGALDKRLSRARTRGRDALRRRKPAIVDLLREQLFGSAAELEGGR